MRFLFASFTYGRVPPSGLDHDRCDVNMFKKTKLPHGGPAVARPPRFTRNINWTPLRNPFLRSRFILVVMKFETYYNISWLEWLRTRNIKKWTGCLRQNTLCWCRPSPHATLCHMASLVTIIIIYRSYFSALKKNNHIRINDIQWCSLSPWRFQAVPNLVHMELQMLVTSIVWSILRGIPIVSLFVDIHVWGPHRTRD